jgi:hypothetical protein
VLAPAVQSAITRYNSMAMINKYSEETACSYILALETLVVDIHGNPGHGHFLRNMTEKEGH